jgi:hypothetical protein
MKQFKKGETYTWPGLYGPSWDVTVVGRTEKTVTFQEAGYEDPADWTTKEVLVDTDGTEMCEAWEYRGHKSYIRADNRF